MNIKLADLLFEEKEEKKDNKSSDTEQKATEDKEESGRAQFKSELSDNDLTQGPEVAWNEMENIIAPNIAEAVKELNNNIKGNIKFRNQISKKSSSEFTKKDKETLKKIEKVNDLPLGLLTNNYLKMLFTKNIGIGLTGKIGGKIHLNPFQMVTGSKQIEGGTSPDLQKFQKLQTYFALISNENSEILRCNGKAVVVAIPAFEAKYSDRNLPLISLLYPDLTKETPVLYNTNKIAYFLLPFDQFQRFQSNPQAIIKTCLTKEKTNESFFYERGLNQLIESSSTSDTSPAETSPDSSSQSQSEEGPETTQKTKLKKILDKKFTLSSGNDSDDSFYLNRLKEKINAKNKNSERQIKRGIKNGITYAVETYIGSASQSLQKNIGFIYYKANPSIKTASGGDEFYDFIYYDFLARLVKNQEDNFFAKLVEKNLALPNEESFKENNFNGLELSKSQIKDIKNKLIEDIRNLFNRTSIKYIESKYSDIDSKRKELFSDSDFIVNIKKYYYRNEVPEAYEDSTDTYIDALVGKLTASMNEEQSSAASSQSQSIPDLARAIINGFTSEDSISNSEKTMHQKLRDNTLEKEQIPLYILISAYKIDPGFLDDEREKIVKNFHEFIDKCLKSDSSSSQRVKAYLSKIVSDSNSVQSIFTGNKDFTEFAVKLYIWKDVWTLDDLESEFTFETRLRSQNLILEELDEKDVNKSSLGTKDDSSKFKINQIKNWFKDLSRTIKNKDIYEFLKSSFKKNKLTKPSLKIGKLKSRKEKEDKTYKSNRDNYLLKRIESVKESQDFRMQKEKISKFFANFIRNSIKTDNEQLKLTIDSIIDEYIEERVKEANKKINKSKINLKIFRDDKINILNLGIFDADNTKDEFEVQDKNLPNEDLPKYLEKTKEFDSEDYDNTIAEVVTSQLVGSMLSAFDGQFLDKVPMFNKFKFNQEKFLDHMKSNNFLNSLLSLINNFEKEVLVKSSVEENLKEKYIDSLGKKEWQKFVIYAYFYAPKKLSALLKESTNLKSKLLSNALYEDDSHAIDLLLNENKLKDIGGKVKDLFVQSRPAQREYISQIISDIIDKKETDKPLGWKASLKDVHPEGDMSDEEKALYEDNINKAKIENSCRLIVNGLYKSLTKNEWKAYSDKKKSDKQSKRQKRRDTRASYYDQTSDKVKSVTEIGSTAALVAAGLTISTGGVGGLLLPLGGLLFSNEIGKVGGGLIKTGMKLTDTMLSGTASMTADSRGSRKSLQKRLDILNYDVKLEEEYKALYDAYVDIRDELDEAEQISDALFENHFVHLRTTPTKFLFEEEEESKPKKKKFKIIEEADALEILAGSNLKLFNPDFSSEDVYNNLLIKLNGILRKYDGIRIKGIENKSVVKGLAKDHAKEVCNTEAKKGEPASPIIDLFTRSQGQKDSPLAQALNDVNHSGGSVTTLLIYMMLTNPQGFASLANSFGGSRGDGIDQLIKFMGGGKIANQAQENTTPEKIAVGQKQMNFLKESYKLALKTNDLKKFINEGLEEKFEDKFEVVEEVKNLKNVDIVCQQFFEFIFNKKPVHAINDIFNEISYYLLNIFITSINRCLDNDDVILDHIENLLESFKKDKIKKVFKRNEELLKTFKLEDSRQHILEPKKVTDINKKSLIKDFISSLKRINKNTLLEESNYLFDDSLLLEEKSVKKIKNISRKKDNIDLQSEWRKLWNI